MSKSVKEVGLVRLGLSERKGLGEVTGELNLGEARGDGPRGDLLIRLEGRLGRDGSWSRDVILSRILSVKGWDFGGGSVAEF